MENNTQSRSMTSFFIIWVGQFVSLIGSGLTAFALSVWIYEQTGSLYLFAANQFCYLVPQIIFSPIAGTLVDRWDRKAVMLISDSGAGLSTLAVALLAWAGILEPWHVLAATCVNAAFNSLQWPAYSASTSLLVPRDQLGRASGLVQTADAISQLVSPALGGLLYATFNLGISGIAAIDFATFLFAAVTMLLFVHIPRPEVSHEARKGKGSIWDEIKFGARYILNRKGLLGLLVFFSVTNFMTGLLWTLLGPLAIDRWGSATYGIIGSIMGSGMLVGTLTMTAWGGTKRKMVGLLGASLLGGLFVMLMGSGLSIYLFVLGGFGVMFTFPIVASSSQAIWQRKVEADIQGRVFAIRRMIAFSLEPLSKIAAPVAVEKLFTPLLAAGGPLAATVVGQTLGTGSSGGIALLTLTAGLVVTLASGVMFFIRPVRRVEIDLPDASLKTTDAPIKQAVEPAVLDEERLILAVEAEGIN